MILTPSMPILKDGTDKEEVRKSLLDLSSKINDSFIEQKTGFDKTIADIMAILDLIDVNANPNTIPKRSNTATLSTTGILFPSIQVPSSDPNCLDDFERGIFPPILTFGGGSTGITYSLQYGRYKKVADGYELTCYMQLTNKGTSTGGAAITGLPFVTGSRCTFNCLLFNTSYVGQIMPISNEASASILLTRASEAGSADLLYDSNFSNTSYVVISGHVFV